MACTKKQLMTLILLVSAILLLCTARAIQSLTTEKDDILREFDILTKRATWHRLPTSVPKTDQIADQGPEMNDFEENCNNVEEEEECLVRRTLTDHVDYIYTQQHNP